MITAQLCYYSSRDSIKAKDNIMAILNECVRVGVKGIMVFGMGLTLREGDREYFRKSVRRMESCQPRMIVSDFYRNCRKSICR